MTFPSPFRHAVSLTIAASASTLNTDFLRAVFHVLVPYRVCWMDCGMVVVYIKGKSFLHSPKLKSSGSDCIQPLKTYQCQTNGLSKNRKTLGVRDSEQGQELPPCQS